MSMANSFTYGMVFQASSIGFAQVKQDLQEGTWYMFEWGEEAKRAGEKAEAGFAIGYRGISRMIFGFQMLSWIGSMTYSSMMRQEVAMITIEQSQENLNDAISRYGANSKQAQRAARSLERAQLYVTRANTMAIFSWTSLGMQIGQAALYSVQYVGALKDITAATWQYVSALGAQAIAWAAAHPWQAAAVIGATVATAAAVNYYLNVNVNQGNGESFDDVWERAGERAREEFRTSGG